MQRQRTHRNALVASFSVYLLPIVGPHVVLFWGWAISAELFTSESSREPLWLAADVALAIALQGAAFVLFRWILSGRVWRWFSVALAMPLLGMALNGAYLIIFPTYFLIEAETAQEMGDWPVACRIDDATLLQVREPVTPDLARAQEAWIGSTTSPGLWWLMKGTDCQRSETEYDRPSARGNLIAVAAGGAALFTSFEGTPPVSRHWHLDPVSGAATELALPPDLSHWVPSLSRDGRAVGWIESRRKGQTWDIWLETREVSSGREREVLLKGLDLGKPEILALDGFEGGLVVYLYPGQILAFDAEGRSSREPIDTGEIRHVGQSFVRLDDGWVAWDTYRDQGRHRLVWNLPSGQARRELPLGSGITDVAVSPDGSLIAVSTTTNLNIGNTQDSFFVVRSHDGAEVYRRFYRPYSRTNMAFLGNRHIAVTRADPAMGRGWIEILEIPEAVVR